MPLITREAVPRHRLVTIREVARVAIRARRHTGGHAGVEFRRVYAPLLAGVIAKKFLV